jgi:hypothetical protein
MENQILAQVIDITGGIDASWFLSAIATISAFLFWTQIKDIKGMLKHLVDLVQLHEVEIAEMKVSMGLKKGKIK